GTAPNPWEVGWVLFHYTDNTHFYYFIAKPTGWELGKEDPSYPGNQRFMATGSTPFPIGTNYHIFITMHGSTISVTVNGNLIVTYTDTQHPYASGSFGLYDEDSSTVYGPVTVG
ncbi:lipoprotein, partial [mine drainage metagenome]